MWESWLDLQTPREKHMPGMHIYKTGNVFKVFWLRNKMLRYQRANRESCHLPKGWNTRACCSPRTQGPKRKRFTWNVGREMSSPGFCFVSHLCSKEESNRDWWGHRACSPKLHGTHWIPFPTQGISSAQLGLQSAGIPKKIAIQRFLLWDHWWSFFCAAEPGWSRAKAELLPPQTPMEWYFRNQSHEEHWEWEPSSPKWDSNIVSAK